MVSQPNNNFNLRVNQKGDSPHKSSLSEYALESEVVPKALICQIHPHQTLNFIHHHTTLQGLSLVVLPTHIQLAYNSLGTIDSALLSSYFHQG